MQKDTLYNQVNPLVRVKEDELLKRSTWQSLENATSLSAVQKILSTTIYAPYVRQKDFQLTFEDTLQQMRNEFFSWAYEVAPEKELVDLFTLRYTHHNLKVLTKAEFTGQNLDDLLIEDGRFTFDQLKSAVHTKASSILPDYLVAGIQEVADYFAEGKILQGIDIIYDRLYLTQIKKIAVELNYPELLNEVTSFIDLSNIMITARAIKQKQTPTFLSTVLSSSGKIEKSEYLEFSGATLAEFTQYLLNSSYHELISLSLDNAVLSLSKMAVLRDDYLSNMFTKSKTIAFGPLPLLALINAKELEEKNLRLIVTGMNNRFSKELIAERMRGNHEL
ncbi:V-type ATPase subunit [Enterococcus timonensis]|uniref:V-type ATPase subunit n=1 Tax=Enterococcus timonensis TaxID=1852364 RepID=UPI0008D8F084|nr:V-type ATPase subunit [Enterococcus timonensis]